MINICKANLLWQKTYGKNDPLLEKIFYKNFHRQVEGAFKLQLSESEDKIVGLQSEISLLQVSLSNGSVELNKRNKQLYQK